MLVFYVVQSGPLSLSDDATFLVALDTTKSGNVPSLSIKTHLMNMTSRAWAVVTADLDPRLVGMRVKCDHT